MWRSLVARLNGVQEAGSSTLPTQTTWEHTKDVCSVFSFNICVCGALAQLGAHNTGSVGVRGSSPLCSTTSEQVALVPIFFYLKKISHPLHCSSFIAKRHARLNCSLVNAFATFRCRYHLFASCACGTNISMVRISHITATFWVRHVSLRQILKAPSRLG